MKDSKKYYSPSQLAKLFDLHSNTIRKYEQFGYISAAQRKSNHYRVFSELHVLQLKICRSIYGYPFFNKRIRIAGNNIIIASGEKKWKEAKQYVETYILLITHEIKVAKDTATILSAWAKKDNNEDKEEGFHTRKEIADYLGISIEAIRNWERNHLIASYRKGDKQETIYSNKMFERIQIVYMLRQAGYSIAAIHNALQMYQEGKIDMVVLALDIPYDMDIVSVGDHWMFELQKLLDSASNINNILNQLSSIKK